MQKLENRYVVIKLSKLNDSQKSNLHSCLSDFVPKDSLVDCVVVEKDWPMYKDTVSKVLAYAEEQKRIKNFVPCKYCNGEGHIIVGYGHDCWGKSEVDTVECVACEGTRRHNQQRYELVLKRDEISMLL